MNIVKVLIASSNVVVRQQIIKLLKKFANSNNYYFLFDEVDSGDECLKILKKKGNPNLLILEDFAQEKTSGPYIVAKIKMKWSTHFLPVLAIGNGTEFKQEFESVEVDGFINFLTFKPSSLWSMVRNAIQN